MKINDLIECKYNTLIKGITDDSRLVKNEYLFVATKGYNVDHYDYIEKAIENGCSFVICDREINYDIPHLIVEDINNLYFELCQKFYDLDLNDYNFIGITGTDGKTTTSTIVKDIIDNCAYIGTNGVELGNKNISTSNTTPCISELYKDLKYIRDNNYHNVVMEVSSEALLHDRVKKIKYKIIGFTNITGDHLNVHGSFENYLKCKLKLLDLVKDNGYVVINGDDSNLQKIKCQNMYSFGKKNVNYIIKNISYVDKNAKIILKYKDIEYSIISPLKGEYNVYNVVMSFIISLLYGIDSNEIINNIKCLTPISGRCEMLDFGQDFDIVLDYAHTINGISSILEAFKSYDRIITVTGCAGGRDHSKRPIIGNIIMNKSDISIFTMDDPRYESVDSIIDEMVGDKKDYIRIVNREEAINYALSIASKGDVVLILGKGRDNYMAIKDKKIPYSDYDVISNYFKN